MRRVVFPIVASMLLTTSALAADLAPLAPGRPAGVMKAQDERIDPLIYVGVVAVAIGIALAVSDNDSDHVTHTTPASTTTSS
jgi:hypothetical protein